MVFNYPNGQAYQAPKQVPTRRGSTPTSTFSNRGMSLEQELNQANAYYLNTGRAVIHKKPTPIQLVKVHYPARAAAKITEAYFQQASTTDYNGIYRGQYIDFDAKETANAQSFPLQNVHEHQIAHLKSIQQQGGLALMVIRFTKRQETYVIAADLVCRYWDAQADGGRKSIPYPEIVAHGALVSSDLKLPCPYLDAVDDLLSKRKN